MNQTSTNPRLDEASTTAQPLPGGVGEDTASKTDARHRQGEATSDLPLTETGASTHVGLATSHPEPLTR